MYPFRNYLPSNTALPLESSQQLNQLDDEIAALEQRAKAERDALRANQDKERTIMRKDPRWTAAGLQYILTGDMAGINTIASDASKEREAKEREILNAALEEKERQAKNDEYRLNYDKTMHLVNGMRKDPNFDENNPVQVAEYNQYIDQANYYGKKLGLATEPYYTKAKTEEPEGDAEPSQQQNPEPAKTQDQIKQSLDAIIAKKDYTNADKADAMNLIAQLSNPADKDTYNSKLSNKGKTKEEKAKAAKEQAEADQRTINEYNAAPADNKPKYDDRRFKIKIVNKMKTLVKREDVP